jgi:hypothetical protein
MSDKDFGVIMANFKAGGVEDKIRIYSTASGLSSEQYRQLLRNFPLEGLARLEAALG